MNTEGLYTINQAVEYLKKLGSKKANAFLLRDWEKAGLIKPKRKQCGKSKYRLYSEDDVRFMDYLLNMRMVGLNYPFLDKILAAIYREKQRLMKSKEPNTITFNSLLLEVSNRIDSLENALEVLNKAKSYLESSLGPNKQEPPKDNKGRRMLSRELLNQTKLL